MKFTKESSEVMSLLGEGVELVGELTIANSLRVEGVVRGKLISDGTLQIGSKGRVDAEIESRRVSINGEFHGVIRATERVEIQREGRVFGDLYTPCLIIEAGALFEGKCNMAAKGGKVEEPAKLKAVEESARASH